MSGDGREGGQGKGGDFGSGAATCISVKGPPALLTLGDGPGGGELVEDGVEVVGIVGVGGKKLGSSEAPLWLSGGC